MKLGDLTEEEQLVGRDSKELCLSYPIVTRIDSISYKGSIITLLPLDIQWRSHGMSRMKPLQQWAKCLMHGSHKAVRTFGTTQSILQCFIQKAAQQQFTVQLRIINSFTESPSYDPRPLQDRRWIVLSSPLRHSMFTRHIRPFYLQRSQWYLHRKHTIFQQSHTSQQSRQISQSSTSSKASEHSWLSKPYEKLQEEVENMIG